MSAEPAKARDEKYETHETAATAISITYSPSSGYGFNPANSTVGNNGAVQFIAPQACWVWTYDGGAYTNVFNGESSNHVQCGAGGNNNFVVGPASSNTTMTLVATNINASQPPPPNGIEQSVKGTIKVGG